MRGVIEWLANLFAGSEETYAEQRAERKPWGWKMTVYVYVEGERRPGDGMDLLNAINQEDLDGRVHFTGARLDNVWDAPRDQGGT